MRVLLEITNENFETKRTTNHNNYNNNKKDGLATRSVSYIISYYSYLIIVHILTGMVVTLPMMTRTMMTLMTYFCLNRTGDTRSTTTKLLCYYRLKQKRPLFLFFIPGQIWPRQAHRSWQSHSRLL